MNLVEQLEQLEQELASRGQLLQRVCRCSATAEDWETAVAEVEQRAHCGYPVAEREQNLQRIAELKEQLRVATRQRRPSAAELQRLDQLLANIDGVCTAWAGYCPTCRGRAVVEVSSGFGPCPDCDGTGRVEPDDEPTCRVCGCTEEHGCAGGCCWVEDPEGGDLCSACAERVA